MNPGLEQLDDILPALGMARPRRVRVRQFIQQDKPRPARQNRIEIHFLEHHSAILHRTSRNRLETLRQRDGLFASMRFDVTNYNLPPSLQLALRRLEHRIRFSNPGAHAEKYLQLSAPLSGGLGLDGRQQGVGTGTL